MSRTWASLALAIGVAVSAVACSDDTTATAPSSTTVATATSSSRPTTFPLEVTGDLGPVTIPAKPTKIISLSPTATESLFAIGAGPQVLAVDDQSTYPTDAPRTELSGFEPNLEAIAAKAPDLVVASNDVGGLVDGLTKLSIPVLLQGPAGDVSAALGQIRTLGTATGNAAAADALAADIDAQIEALVASTPRSNDLSVYHELDDTFYSATSSTFIGQAYQRFGLANIADEADDAAQSYPQLSAEQIVTANPDLIFLADAGCCQQSAATVAARPGWGSIAAVKGGNVVVLDDDIASRWGPRIVELYRAISVAVARAV